MDEKNLKPKDLQFYKNHLAGNHVPKKRACAWCRAEDDLLEGGRIDRMSTQPNHLKERVQKP